MPAGMRWMLGVGVGLVLLVLAAAAIVPFVVPVATFIPQVARIASEKLNQPVSIANLDVSLLPTPRIVVSGIRIGKKDLVEVGEVEIVPDLVSFISGSNKTIRLIRAERVRIKEAALAIPKTMPQREAGDPITVRRLVMKEVKVFHSKARLPEFDLDAELGPGFAIELARIETRDKTLKLTADPQKDGSITFILNAKNWTVPAGPPVRLDALAAEGRLSAKLDSVDVPKLSAKLFGGSVGGSIKAGWGRQWTLSGAAKVEGMDVVQLQKLLGKPAKLSGKLNTQVSFSAAARTPDQLVKVASVDGPFEIVSGAYHGVDLTKVGITSTGTEGSTPFEEFKGIAQVRNQAVKITELCVRSPKVVAGGNVDVAADERLSGKLDVSMARTGGFVGVPVSLSGTASDPSLRPTKGYVIGALVGTVLMPGIGTSIGSSIGSRIEGTSSCK